MSYVSVSNEEESKRIGYRDVVVTWPMTIAPSEWFEDLQGRLEVMNDSHGVEH